MNKVDFAYWLECLDKELLAIGAEKFTYQDAEVYEDGSGQCSYVPGYRFETSYGILELHPDIPLRPSHGRPLPYDCAVYGRFQGDNWPGKGVCQSNPKWNHLLGTPKRAEIMETATFVATRVALLGSANRAEPASI